MEVDRTVGESRQGEKKDWTVGESRLGCALTFASEAKFEIEAKISFRLEAKKNLISHDSPKIWSENEGKISENFVKKSKRNEN